jgi:hypothetical protein
LQGIESSHQGIFSPDQGIRRWPAISTADVKRVSAHSAGTMITGSASSPTRPNACLMFGSADPVTPEVQGHPAGAGGGAPASEGDPPIRRPVRRSALRSGQPEDRQPVRAAQLVQVQCAPCRASSDRGAAHGRCRRRIDEQAHRGVPAPTKPAICPSVPVVDPHIASSDVFRRSVVTSSVIPSAKYCWSGSLLRLTNGSTTIDRRGAFNEGDVIFTTSASCGGTVPVLGVSPIFFGY